MMLNSCHGEESVGELHLFFIFGGLERLILVAVYFKNDSAVGAQMSLSTVRTFSSALFS